MNLVHNAFKTKICQLLHIFLKPYHWRKNRCVAWNRTETDPQDLKPNTDQPNLGRNGPDFIKDCAGKGDQTSP